MNSEVALKKVLPFFPTAKTYKNDELIIEPKNNIYFRIDNVNSDLEFDCKMIEWLSRPAHKGLSNYWQNYVRRGLNSYFKKTWSKDNLNIIYTKLGNNVNRELCLKFIIGDLNLSVLNDNERSV